MATYNAEKTIGVAIDSVLSQTHKLLELIIVDDCSSDNTLRIVSYYNDARIRVISHHVNLGVSQTRHDGVVNARGGWIAILDSDDVWEKDKLEKQIKLQSRTGAVLLFTGSSFINEMGTPINWTLKIPTQMKYRKLLKQNLISNSSVLVKKELYERYEIIGDKMHEDFACWLNMLKDGIVAYGVNEPLLIYRLSTKSKSGNKLKAICMNWNTYREIGLNRIESAYYMMWYIYNGIKKYKNLI